MVALRGDFRPLRQHRAIPALWLKTLESLDTLDAIISPENIRRNLQSENDIYKFEYCSMDENTYKIVSFIPLEWNGTKLVKALLASMDVSQEKKAEIESHKALKEAYRAAENASCAKTEFLSNMSHDIRTPMNAIIGLTAIAGANIESQDRVVECLGIAKPLDLNKLNDVLKQWL